MRAAHARDERLQEVLLHNPTCTTHTQRRAYYTYLANISGSFEVRLRSSEWKIAAAYAREKRIPRHCAARERENEVCSIRDRMSLEIF